MVSHVCTYTREVQKINITIDTALDHSAFDAHKFRFRLRESSIASEVCVQLLWVVYPS